MHFFGKLQLNYIHEHFNTSMACIDIYQALTEDRPYKNGLSHEKTCEMLDDMAQKGFVDSDISKKIRECFGGI